MYMDDFLTNLHENMKDGNNDFAYSAYKTVLLQK